MIKSASPSGSGSRSVIEPANRMVMPLRMEYPISHIRSTRDFERLKAENARLETFSLPPGWPVTFIRADDCAKAGFFFLQDGDKVQCAFCRGVAGEWEEGDNPLAEHRRHFPRCPFICNLPVGNISIGHELEAAQIQDQEEAAGVDVCGPFAPAARQFSSTQEPASVRGAQPLTGNMNDVATSLAIKVCGNGPVHASLVTLQSRLKTFSFWPTSSGQKAETLADAGFFYIGRLDHVKCFYCDGGLRNWEPADDPWLEHARWFPNCSFVVLNKGDGFVKAVTKSKPPVVPHQYLNKLPSLGQSAPTPRRVSDQELRDLIDTPIVQAALEMGMELGKVKGALQRKIQQTGQPFMTTEALLEAVLGRDSEYESDTDSEEDNDEDEDLMPAPRTRPNNNLSTLNISVFNGPGSATSEASSSSSAEHSSGSGDEETPACNEANPPRTMKTPASRSASGDSGVSSMSATSSNDRSENEEASNFSAHININNPGISSSASNDSVNSTEEQQNSENEITTANNPKGDTRALSNSKEMEMEEELRKLREATQCKICMDNRVEVVFLPCGHLVSCTRCATALSNCAVCRQPIKAYVKTYLS